MKKELLEYGSHTDAELLKFWEEFSLCPIDADDTLDQAFYFFPKGTEKTYVWHWFDNRYSKGIYVLIYGEEAYSHLNACEPLIDKVLNVDLPKHIPKLEKCLENPIFKKWFEDKFCKWTQKIDHPDMVFLWENIDTFLENQKDFE